MTKTPRRPRRLFVAALALAAAILVGEGGAAQDAAPGSGHDSSQPIEITADTLEVLQADKVAVFRGKVDAVQGDMLLRADRLVVHYRETEADEENLGIARIDAEGNVFVSSPRETAQGRRGVYDVDEARIDLTGGVILTRGDNVIQGDSLRMDLESGRSSVAGAGAGSGGRVHGLFVPRDAGGAGE